MSLSSSASSSSSSPLSLRSSTSTHYTFPQHEWIPTYHIHPDWENIGNSQSLSAAKAQSQSQSQSQTQTQTANVSATPSAPPTAKLLASDLSPSLTATPSTSVATPTTTHSSFWLSSTHFPHKYFDTTVHCAPSSSSSSSSSLSSAPLLTIQDAKHNSDHGEFSVHRVDSSCIGVSCASTEADECNIIAPSKTLVSLHPPSSNILSLSVCSDFGASGTSDGGVRLWDPNSFDLRRDLKGHYGDVHLLKFFPSNVLLLSSAADLQLKIWACDSGECAASFCMTKQLITAVQFVDRGKWIVVASKDGTLRVLECAAGKAVAEYHDRAKEHPAINDVVILGAPDVERALSTSFFQPPDSASIAASNSSLSSSSSSLPSSSFSSSSYESYVALCGCSDERIRLYDLRAGPYESTTFSFAISSTSSSSPIRLGSIDKVSALPASSPYTFCFGTSNGVLATFDTRVNRTSPPLISFAEDDAAIQAILPCSAQNLRLWTANAVGNVTLWQLGEGGQIKPKSAQRNTPRIATLLSGVDCEPVNAAVLSADGGKMYTAAFGAIRVYRLSGRVPPGGM